MKGSISSIDPMRLDCGPGIRVSITLDKQAELFMTPNELVDCIRKFRPYLGSDGGVTLVGDGLMEQIPFLKEVCKIAHKAGINTCIQIFNNYCGDLELFKYVDTIIFNIDNLSLIDNKFSELAMFFECLDKYQIGLYINVIVKKEQHNVKDNIKEIKHFFGVRSNILSFELVNDDYEEYDFKELKKVFEEV